VELFAAIRWDHEREGWSVRALARRHRVHRRTVRQALASGLPAPRKSPVRTAPKLEPAKPHIDTMLREDLKAPRKQRHTARRIWVRLLEEFGCTDVSYSSVRDYVARRRPELAAEMGATELARACVPQSPEPGEQAEVDFADLWIRLRGVLTKVFLFTFRLSYSGAATHRAFATQGQEAFLEGHLDAFSRLGGVPVGAVRYDNLRSAVSRVLFGRNRVESQRWVAFRGHFLLQPFYCQPGEEGAHEKGGVEGEVGRFRRTHLVPVPQVDSLAELNERIVAADAADLRRRIGHRLRPVGEDLAVEQKLLRPVPAHPFPTALVLFPRVDRFAQVTVRQCLYSVPARLIGRRVRVELSASELLVHDGGQLVARHERVVARGGRVLVLDHYLEVLFRKPGALPGSTPLSQARATGKFTAAHEAFWAAARAAHGDGDGSRALVEVLLLHRNLAHADVVAGLQAALAVGATSADIVAVEARRAADTRRQATPPPAPEKTAAPTPAVASLTERRLRELPDDGRPVPDVSVYDSLLGHAADGQRGGTS
jgi:transposase